MTTQDLINLFSANQYYVLAYFVMILVLAAFVTFAVNRENIGNLKYLLSFLVYAVAIPGILAILLVLYQLLMLRTNVLNVSIIAYFVPIIAMICTLLLLNRKVKLEKLPGFQRLSGLVIIIAIAFIIIFILQRTYFGVLILGGLVQVLLVFGVLMLALRMAAKKLMK